MASRPSWRRLRDKVKEGQEIIRVAARARINDLEIDLGLAHKNYDAVIAQRDAANAQRDAATSKIEGLLVELDQLKLTLEATRAELAALCSMDVNSDPYQLMLTKLERVSGRAFAKCRQLHAQRDAANAQGDKAFKAGYMTGFKNLAAERNKAIDRADRLLAELDELKSDVEELSNEVAELSKELYSVRAERDAARAERDAARAERDVANAERDVANAERDAARAERDAARAELRSVE